MGNHAFLPEMGASGWSTRDGDEMEEGGRRFRRLYRRRRSSDNVGMTNPSEWVDALKKLPGAFLFLLAVIFTLFCGFGVYSSDATLQNAGLIEVRRSLPLFFGLGFLISLGFVIAIFIFGIYSYGEVAYRSCRERDELRERLKSMNDPERECLSRFIRGKSRVAGFYHYEVAMLSLENSGVVRRQSPIAEVPRKDETDEPSVLFSISDRAFTILLEDGELLVTANDRRRKAETEKKLASTTGSSVSQDKTVSPSPARTVLSSPPTTQTETPHSASN
jgi:hypothetical protein